MEHSKQLDSDRPSFPGTQASILRSDLLRLGHIVIVSRLLIYLSPEHRLGSWVALALAIELEWEGKRARDVAASMGPNSPPRHRATDNFFADA
jgi:hypothetical protein